MSKLQIGDIVELEEYPISEGYNPYTVLEFMPSTGHVLLEEMGYAVEMGEDGVKQWHPLQNVRQYPTACPTCGTPLAAN